MPAAPSSGGGGGGQRPGDVRAGGAYVEVSAKDRLSAQFASLLARAKAFAAGLQSLGKSIAFTGVGVLTPLAGLFGAGSNRAGEIQRMAEELGFTVTQMQRLKFAADAAGVSIEDVLRRPEKYAGLMSQAIVLDPATIRASARASAELSGAFINLQAAMLPVVQTVGPMVTAFAQFVARNGDLVRVLAAGAVGLTAVGLAAFTAGKALALVAGGVSLVATAFGLLLTKTGLLIGGVGVLATAFLTFTTGGRRLASDVGTAFARMGETFGTAIKAMSEAVKAGDFKRAFEVLATGIEAIWYEMILNMSKAFSTFIENNRDRLIALGSIIGGLKGAGTGGRLGARFGPWGALIGGGLGSGLGALGGGLGADQLAKLLDGLGNNTGLEQRRADAQKRLAELAKPGPQARIENEQFAKRIEATRGAFRVLRNGNQQFGASDKLETKQLEELKKIAKTLTAIQQAMIEQANAMREQANANRFK